VLPPRELYRLGFAMVAYPTSLIFRVARAIENALADLKAGRPTSHRNVSCRTCRPPWLLRYIARYTKDRCSARYIFDRRKRLSLLVNIPMMSQRSA